jgi:CheY-like chemotaxis protein
VSSAPGEGSTFTLYLPLEHKPAGESPQEEAAPVPAHLAPVSNAAAADLAPQATAGLDGRQVLVVDDDIRNVFAMTSALELHGMRVLHADSGKEGIEILKSTPGIDAILMDVMMPGLDGLDTMRIVRQLEGYRSVPIVAVTAKAMVGDREKCMEAGATDYIAKPVNVDVLLATLWRALQAQHA